MNRGERFRREGQRAVLAAVLLLPTVGLAQDYVFGPNVRVNDDPPGQNQHSTLTGSQRMLAARGDTVYAVWKDDRTGTYFHIYFARSTNGGQSFEPNIRLDSAEGDAEKPTIALDTTGAVHVCWENSWPNYGVFYSKSTNGGRSFSDPLLVSDTGQQGLRGDPVIATSRDGMLIYILGLGGPFPGVRLHLSRSIDGGRTFQHPEIVVCSDTTVPLGNYSTLVWQDTVLICIWDGIYVARSLDGGRTFAPPIHAVPGGHETVAAIDSFGRIYVVGDGPYFEMSDNLGDTFGPGQRIAPDAGLGPAISVSPDGRVFVTYDFWNGLDGRYEEVRMVSSTDRGTTFSPPVNPSDGPYTDDEAITAVTANDQAVVFVAWEDTRHDTSGFIDDVYLAAGALSSITEQRLLPPSVPSCVLMTSMAGRSLRVDYHVVRGPAKVEVYDLNGRLTRDLVEHASPGGQQSVVWDETDARGRTVRRGVYFVRLETPEGNVCRKVVLVRD